MLTPFSKFSLKDLEIDKDVLLTLFLDLELDKNDKDLYNLNPFRARKILFTKFIDNELFILPNKEFIQNVSDVRNKKREFKSFVPSKEEHLILDILCKKFTKLYDIKDNLEITFHFVKIFANKEGSSNSPEGIHRDGFDILVPCLVLERENIEGGYSRIFDNGELVYNKIIDEGEGLVLNEKDYVEMFHDVTPIKLKEGALSGHRTIMGIDINVLG